MMRSWGCTFTHKPVDPLRPMFKPTAMTHQVYPYINAARGVPAAVAGWDPPADSNSLLYCEMVEGNPLDPQQPVVGSTGLFTTQEPMSTGRPRVDGCFVLSHQLFLERYLLPMLQSFNKSSEVYPYTQSTDFSDDKSQINWNYSVGNDGKHGPADPVYKFKPDQPLDPTKYTYTVDNTRGLDNQPVKNPSRDIWVTFKSGGKKVPNCLWPSFLTKVSGGPVVTVSWVPGQSSFSVDGVTEYWYDGEFATNSLMTQPYGWLR